MRLSGTLHLPPPQILWATQWEIYTCCISLVDKNLDSAEYIYVDNVNLYERVGFVDEVFMSFLSFSAL